MAENKLNAEGSYIARRIKEKKMRQRRLSFVSDKGDLINVAVSLTYAIPPPLKIKSNKQRRLKPARIEGRGT